MDLVAFDGGRVSIQQMRRGMNGQTDTVDRRPKRRFQRSHRESVRHTGQYDGTSAKMALIPAIRASRVVRLRPHDRQSTGSVDRAEYASLNQRHDSAEQKQEADADQSDTDPGRAGEDDARTDGHEQHPADPGSEQETTTAGDGPFVHTTVTPAGGLSVSFPS